MQPVKAIDNLELGQYDDYARNLCKQYGVEYTLLKATIKRESEFDPNKINYNNNGTCDYGLGQINSSNFTWVSKMIGHQFLWNDPKDNLLATVVMLKYYQDDSKRIPVSTVDAGNKHINSIRTIGSYNRGTDGYMRYIRYNGLLYDHINDIIKYKEEYDEKEGHNGTTEERSKHKYPNYYKFIGGSYRN